MTKKKYWMRPPLHSFAVLLLACYVPSVLAAAPIESIKVDLSPLIDESARDPVRFAVDIKHPVSASSQGQWTDNGFSSTWTYTTRIETAEEVRDRVLEAAAILPLEQLGTTDDCGFSPFADDVSTARETAFAKIRARVEGTALAASQLGV